MRTAFFAAAVVLLTGSVAEAVEAPRCSVADLIGKWGFSLGQQGCELAVGTDGLAKFTRCEITGSELQFKVDIQTTHDCRITSRIVEQGGAGQNTGTTTEIVGWMSTDKSRMDGTATQSSEHSPKVYHFTAHFWRIWR